MANNYIKFSEAPEATDAQMTDAGLVGVSIVDANSSTGFSTRKSPLSKLANYVINKFNSLSLGGVTQTVKAAIDSILTLLGNSAMGTTATTITGAIAEHESDITSLNSSFPFVAKYITRTVTLPQGSAASPSVTELDLTSEAPAGKSLYFAIVAVGVYCLPYIGPSAATYTTAYRISTNKLSIYNGGATWNGSQTVYILGFFR